MEGKLKSINVELVGEELHESYHLKKYILGADDEIPLPRSGDFRVVIFALEEGKSALVVKDSLIKSSMLSQHLGLSRVGQRVADLLTLIDFVGREDSMHGRPIDLNVSGAAGPVAIYAAMFRPQITSIHVSSSIQTYFDILNFPMEVDWYSYVVPHVLAYFDLPDLISLRGDLEIRFRGEKFRTVNHTENLNRKIE